MSDTPIRVLLVDDEPELVQFLSKRLKRKGLEATEATSGKEGLKLARKHTFDVAVLDLKMPEMDGLQMLHELRKIQPFIQVVMLTGHGSIETALESGREHAFRFLAKPAEFKELLTVIEEGAEIKRKELRQAFDDEVSELISSSMDPADILNETKRLRQKYDQMK